MKLKIWCVVAIVLATFCLNVTSTDRNSTESTVEYKPNFDHLKGLPPVFSWEKRRANLSCLAQSIPNATIQWYWRDRHITDYHDPNLVVESHGPRSDLLINPRDARYYSAYTCKATNRLGTATHEMILREAQLPFYVTSATAFIITATTMTFNIVGPPTEFGLPILTYSVQYKEITQPDWTYAFNKTWTVANENTVDSFYTIDGLRPATRYQARFAARNLRGLGPWGGYQEFSTPVWLVPEAPRFLHAPDQIADSNDEEQVIVSPYSDHFDLSWKIPADNGEPIDFYQVRYCLGRKVDGIWTEHASDCVTEDVSVTVTNDFKMSNLHGDTYYRIEVRAHNAVGFSQPSAALLIRTAREDVRGQNEPHLQILPIQKVQRKPVGKPFLLTCRPNVPDPNLITDIQWRDNNNMRVEPKETGQSSPSMYTEVLPGDESLALMIRSLTDSMAGTYYCSAVYANNVQLETSVKIETYASDPGITVTRDDNIQKADKIPSDVYIQHPDKGKSVADRILETYETDETRPLSDDQLKRLVLLKQVKVLTLQQQQLERRIVAGKDVDCD